MYSIPSLVFIEYNNLSWELIFTFYRSDIKMLLAHSLSVIIVPCSPKII